jgi:predicted TIM-barrel fold metal-dependent hydrolase
VTTEQQAYPIVSADSHVNEPPGLWEERLPAGLRERGPKITRIDGRGAWMWEDRIESIRNGMTKDAIRPGTGSMATRTRGYYGRVITPDDVDKEFFSTSPEVWLTDMDVDGVDISVLYPGIGLSMYTIQQQDLRLACLRAYNDWAAEFCAASNGRLAGVALIPFDDGVDEAVKELERAVKLGHRGALMPTWPAGNVYMDPEFDRFWAAAQSLNVPLSLHRGSGTGGSTTGAAGHHPAAGIVYRYLAAIQALGDMVFTGIFDRFPALKVVSVESNFGWAPFVWEQSDDQHRRQQAWDQWKLQRNPSEYWKENIYYTFLEDRYGIQNRHAVGVDKVMWSNDYPHTVTQFPESRRYIDEMFTGVPEDEKRMMISENARRIYKL